MKKLFVLILVFLMLLPAGCSKDIDEIPAHDDASQDNIPVDKTQSEVEPEPIPQRYSDGMLYGTRLSLDTISELPVSDDYGILTPFDLDGDCGLVTNDGCIVLDAVCSEIYRAVCYSADYSWSINLDIYVLVKEENGVNRYAACALDGSWTTGFDYEDIISGNDGVLCVKNGEKNLAEYIDQNGSVLFDTADFACLDQLTPYNGAYLSGFSEGCCPVSFSDGGFRYIDFEGTIRSDSFEQAMSFSDGIAAVQKDGLWGYIDTDFNWIVQPEYISALSSCARTAIALGQDYIYYILSPNGDVLSSYDLNSMYFGSRGEFIVGWSDSGVIYFGADLVPVTINGQPAQSCGTLYYTANDNGLNVLIDQSIITIPNTQNLITGSTADMLCVTIDDEYNAIVDLNGEVLAQFSNCNMYVVSDSVTGKNYVVVEDMVSHSMTLYDGNGNVVADNVTERDEGPIYGLVRCRDNTAQGCKNLENKWVMAME